MLKRLSVWLSLVVVAGLMVGLHPLAAVAQPQDFQPATYISDFTGWQIEVSGPRYEISDAKLIHYGSGDGEVVNIESDLGSAEVSFYDDTDTPEESIEAYLSSLRDVADNFTIVDQGIDGNITFVLATFSFSGTDMAFYMQVHQDLVDNIDMVETLMSTTDEISTDLGDAQSEILIDGIPFMDGLEPTQFDDVLAGNATLPGSTGTVTTIASSPTVVATVASDTTPEADSTPTNDSVLGTPSDTYTFSDSGVVLDLYYDFSFSDDPFTYETGETVYVRGTNTVSMISVSSESTDPETAATRAMDELTSDSDGHQPISLETRDGGVWVLETVEINGENYLAFLDVDSTLVPGYLVMQMHILREGEVRSGLLSIQDSIRIDGEPVLQNLDVEEIVRFAEQGEAGTQATPQASPTTDASPSPTWETTGTPESTATPTGSTTRVTTEDPHSRTTRGQATETPVASPTPSGPGLVSDTEYESPQYVRKDEWAATLSQLDTSAPEPLASDTTQQFDTIRLATVEGGTVVWIDFVQADDYSAVDYVTYWQSPEYLGQQTSPDASILLQRTFTDNGGVVYTDVASNGDPIIVIREAIELGDGQVALIMLIGSPDTIVDSYESMVNHIQIDGDDAGGSFTPEELRDALN